MVVLDNLPGLKVWVEVDKEPLKEYEDQDGSPDKKKCVTRFIAAKSNQNFRICVEATNTKRWKGEGIRVVVRIDGTVTDSWMWETCDMRGRGISDSMWIGDGKRARYKFSALDVVSDGMKLAKEAKRLAKVGQIEVCVWNIKDIEENGSSAKKRRKRPKGVGVVSEKALKGQALSHTVEFDDIDEDQDAEEVSPNFTFNYIEPKSGPFAKYIFCYRSMEALKSLLIVPRTPSPEPPIPLEERDITTLNPDELKELQKRFLAMRDKQTQIKRERDEDEATPPARKKARPSAGDTQLEIDDQGGFRQASTAGAGKKKQDIIEID